MNFQELCELLSNDTRNRFELILSYDDFAIWKDSTNEKYYYLEGGINDASECYEVVVVARLQYDVLHDLQIEHKGAGELLHQLFVCDCCGEHIYDIGIEYLWFERK